MASRKTSYSDIIKADCLDEVVRELMMEQHKQMIRDLMQGKLNAENAPHEATYKPQPTARAAPEPAPQKSVAAAAAPVAVRAPAPPPKEEPKEKSLDDIILDLLSEK